MSPPVSGPGARPPAVAATVLLLAGSLAACTDGGSTGGAGGVLTVSTGSTGSLVRNFNPFSASALQATHGMIYEPLFKFNAAEYGDVEGWLGEDFEWSNGGRTLSILIRTDATWNDGEPFTVRDVAHTFRMLKDDQGLNQFGLPLAEVATEGPDTCVLTFSEPAYSKEYFILGRQKMLPAHVWRKIPDEQRKTDLNADPVGTGAWEVTSVKGTTMELTARDDYYIDGLPHFDTLRYLSFGGNDAAGAAIKAGKVDWGGHFIPEVEENYLAQDPGFDLVNIPLAVTYLVPNAARGPTADARVRTAISAALDRDFISQSVYDGHAPPVHPSALLLPDFAAVLDPQLEGAEFRTGAEVVEAELTEAGYVRSGDSWVKDGRQLSLTVLVVSGWTDYLRVAELAKQQLAKVGIELHVETVSYARFTNKRSIGDFELLLDNYGYTPDPRAYYDQLINSEIAPPIGESTNVGNYGRYRNEIMDRALDEIASTDELEQQQAAHAAIQREFIRDMPLIPLFAAQNEQQFNGNRVTGYPTEDNLYASPSVWLDPDAGWVAARLKPKAEGDG